MKDFQGGKLIFFIALFSLTFALCEAQEYKRGIRNPEKALFGKSLNTKRVKYRESPSIVRAKRKQAANQRKLDKEYDDYVKKERKHALEIQSPEVRSRMLENRKEADLKFKEKIKKMNKSSRKAGKKYK